MARSSTTFSKGTSGNPNGRPRVVFEIRDLARQYGPAVITQLAQMAGLAPGGTTESSIVRLAAMKELLDRGYGKATQPLSSEDATSAGALHLLAAQAISAQLIEQRPQPRLYTPQERPQLQHLLDAPLPLE